MRRGLLGRPEGEVTWVTGEARAHAKRGRGYTCCAPLARQRRSLGSSKRKLLRVTPAASFKSSGLEQAQLPTPEVVAGRLGSREGAC